MRMVIYVLAVLISALFMGCGDNGNPGSAEFPSRICYDKALTYSDVQNYPYSKYKEEWVKAACDGGYIGSDCISYNANATLVKHVCIENVDSDPTSEPRISGSSGKCSVYYYLRNAKDTDSGYKVWIDESGELDSYEVESRFSSSGYIISKIEEICY